MKKFQILLLAALCGAAIGTASQASAQTARPCYATVVRVEGEASYSLDKINFSPLVPGKYLPPGSSIRTGQNGVVDVVLGTAVELPQASWAPERIGLAADYPVRGMISYKPTAEQNTVRLMPKTLLSIDKLTTTDTGADTVSDTELNLQKGKIFASVKKLSAAAQYIIKTPTGIAGVRGTQFSITLNDDGTVQSLDVYKTTGNDGLILSLTLPDGTTQTWIINQGQMYSPGSTDPVAIPPAVEQMMREAFSALRTIYVEVIGFDYDRTLQYESSDFGHHPHTPTL